MSPPTSKGKVLAAVLYLKKKKNQNPLTYTLRGWQSLDFLLKFTKSITSISTSAGDVQPDTHTQCFENKITAVPKYIGTDPLFTV